MGREIRRVPLDFEWPLDQRWEGFVSPSDGTADCNACIGTESDRATGYSRIGNSFYSLAQREWAQVLPLESNRLTPEEIKLMQAVERSTTKDKRYRRKMPFVLGPITDSRMFIYCTMKHLAQSLHVSFEKTFLCPVCKGSATVVVDSEQNQIAKKWRRKNPPKGTGWQVWETTSEGSPITPVFATADELVDHLVTVGTTGDAPTTRECAEIFVGAGFAMSAVIVDNQMYTGINSAAAAMGPTLVPVGIEELLES